MAFTELSVSGEIVAYSYMVQRGKPAAMLPIHGRNADDTVKFIKDNFGLNTYVEDLGEGWKTLWIYKHEHILSVIKKLPQVPETTFDHWVLGKLFGYDESSIQQFIKGR